MEASMVSQPTAGPDTPSTSKGEAKFINLALQGGGAHGAFTWGVLDRLLEEDRIGFDGISATSAGAMNATVFASGMAIGGRGGAKKALTEFWRRISHAALKSPLRPTLLDRLLGDHSKAQSRGFVFSELLTRLFLPYEFNPLNQNPLSASLAGQRRFRHAEPDDLPQSATEILNRVNEISFNSSLLREMRAIRFVTRLIDDGTVINGSLRRMRIHTRGRRCDIEAQRREQARRRLGIPRPACATPAAAGRAMARRAFRPPRRRIYRGSRGRLHVTAAGAVYDRLFRRRPGVGGRSND